MNYFEVHIYHGSWAKVCNKINIMHQPSVWNVPQLNGPVFIQYSCKKPEIQNMYLPYLFRSNTGLLILKLPQICQSVLCNSAQKFFRCFFFFAFSK